MSNEKASEGGALPRTPRLALRMGDFVAVRGHLNEGKRRIAGLYCQTAMPGGVRLHLPVDGFSSWNEDELILVRRKAEG